MPTDFISIPFEALIKRPEAEEAQYIEQLSQLPKNVRAIVTSARTGSFLRGVLKTNDLLSLDNSVALSMIVIEICFGKKTLAQLPSMLSTDLRLANDKAQKMASEIERDLFAPIILEYNEFLANKRKQTGSTTASAQSSGAHNVLDLKNNSTPPAPPPIPPTRFK